MVLFDATKKELQLRLQMTSPEQDGSAHARHTTSRSEDAAAIFVHGKEQSHQRE